MNIKPAKSRDSHQELIDCIDLIKHTDYSVAKAMPDIVELARKIRPQSTHNHEFASLQLQTLTDILRNDRRALSGLKNALSKLLANSEIYEVLINSGIPVKEGFFSELNSRITSKFLPPLKDKGSFLYVIDSIFYERTDYKWVNAIDDEIWLNFFALLDFELDLQSEAYKMQFISAMQTISCRITTLAADTAFRKRISETSRPAFMEQNRLIYEILAMESASIKTEDKSAIVTKNLTQQLDICECALVECRERNVSMGTSLQQAFLLDNLQKLIDRLRIILEVINHQKVDVLRIVRNFKAIVENENTKFRVRKHLYANIHDLSYRISEHALDTGEHYITSDKRGYVEMFKSAMKGGFIISFVAVIKNLLHAVQMAPFWQSFAYSVNYATGFVLIHVTGSTLATKQPAMTASTIAGAMDKKRYEEPNMAKLAILVSQVFRSQTASFVGNLCIVFPLTLALAYLWALVFGSNIVSSEEAQQLLDNNNPLKSWCLLYACYTGIFLYLSGIISGYFDNKVVYGNIPQRLREHPLLRRTFSRSALNRFASYIGKNLGPIMGNLALGFFLGTAGFWGYIFGINFDIRHITISTGNFAIGLQGLGFNVSRSDWLWTLVGVLMIGWFNFMLSFVSAFITASYSRDVHFAQYKRFLKYLSKLAVQYPLDFIRPPKTARVPEDFLKEEEK